ncbi:SEL1-like repeat protein [Massilia sp. CF038]|uniref:tetratricopeptide repeat protein n=1 Tax=Massilia sp. CF038 TaxID=1881045 RepID=UPI00091AD4CF|nr:SEL1-like repeat protein [Massilia sp. CF038]SHH39609.1 hypothetical protein SAMN05428948_3813 [Massilia sp. CF038]
MANREELGLIRGARGGQPHAQLELGRLYLYGSAGLPKSLPTALHWLERAAQQGCGQACELIGTYIPLELARQSPRPLAQWYEHAYDAGVQRAGIVLAHLTLEQNDGAAPDQARRAKALRALEAAARDGVVEAQCLYARYAGSGAASAAGAAAGRASAARPVAPAAPAAPEQVSERDQLWAQGDWAAYLALALPQARALAPAPSAQYGAHAPAALTPADAVLLSRCAQALEHTAGAPDDIERYRLLAAAEHEPHAQMAVGLWHARMRVDGKRIPGGAGSANFKKAIRWLSLAGEQGLAEAWYALSRIYVKPEFSQRNIADAQTYLERAAEMGYRDAQLECGSNAWRARREHESNDVRAIYWLQRAAEQGCSEAAASLQKIAPRQSASAFGLLAAGAHASIAARQPLLGARLQLAAVFGLSRAEALLLDVRSADQGHCLVIDIRASYGRSKRRLVTVASEAERAAIDEALRQFAGIDSGPGGPEGNYRQRLYRLKTLLPEAVGCDEPDAEGFRLAA